MSEKMKMKDLAAEIGKDLKDLQAAAKDLGIQVKNAATALTESEVSRLKAHFTPEKRDNVIVRRRAKVEAAAPLEEAAPANAPEEHVPGRAEDLPREKTATAAKARIVKPVEEEAAPAAPAEQPAPAEEAAQPKEKIKKTTAPAARVISRPGDEKAPSAEPEEAALATDAERKSPEVAARAENAKPQAFAPNLSAEPERGADGQALSSVPVMGPRQDRDGNALPGGSKKQNFELFSDDASDDDDERGRKKRQDTPPVSQVRVISKPSAPAPRAEQPRQDGRPSGSYPPRDGARPGGYPPRDGARPAGGYPPRDGARPAGGYPPRDGARPAGGGYPPRDGARPAGGYPPRDGARPGGGYPPRGGAAPAAPQPFAGGEAEGDSRKKRGKGRRTVDFTAGKDAVGRRFKDGEGDGAWNKSARKGKGKKGRELLSASTQPIKAAKRKIRVDEVIRVSDLAHQMGLKTSEIIKVLFGLGVMATINQTLDVDTATLVASEFDYEIEKVGFSEEELLEETPDSPENLIIRPPVVTIMGHVDHGKTSLLDAIRKSSVATGEAGGITQHIGAYHVKTKKGDIVFLDTPGHAAFTAMRARGAEVTDIVVLVVAADDGVMEQTREAINHAKAAGVPIMVAVNKIDKPEANLDRVKRELAEQGLVSEDWGGDTVFSPVSAKTREGLDDLLELLALQAEILELKANPHKPARGHIVEAKLDKGRGSLGTVLIQQGTLKVGDPFVCGVHYGRVRAMFDDQGRKVKEAGPSMPVEVQGFEGVPEAGEEFVSLPDEKTARRIADARAVKVREKALARESKITLETFLSSRAGSTQALTLNLVVKADVQGSLEAIVDALKKLPASKVRINVVHGGAGAISESDVLLASASDAIIIGFNVRPASKAKELAEQEKIDIRFYDIIYKLVEEVTNAMEGMLAPVEKEVYLGTAEVRETFNVPKVGTVAGCHVSDGKFVRHANVRLLRNGVVVHTGKLSSLRRFKDDVKEVLKGYECGMGLENYNDVKVGDILEAFEIVEEAASL